MKKRVSPVKKVTKTTKGMGFEPFGAGVTCRFTEKSRTKK